jgi:aldehyde dehydrogenase (NAD+)
VAKNAAPTVKRVHQELGGKSPNIILEDADFASAVAGGVRSVMMNSGQSCNAPTRMLVPQQKMDEVIKIAKEAAEQTTVGSPDGNAQMGPVVSEVQFDKIQKLIQAGVDEGATLVTGGPGPARRAGQGLLRQADRVRQRHERDDDRQGRDLRAGGVHPGLRQRGRGGEGR